ncbi:MAG: hypothetical protein AAF789_03170 [Bacteroidota bacterium]
MKKLLSLIVILFLAINLSLAQVGQEFPAMETETLTNQFITIPHQLKGDYTLIGLAFSKKAEDYLKGWFEPVYNTFIYVNPNPGPFDFSYGINSYFIPMFTGAKRPAYQKVMKKMQKTIDPRLQKNVLFYQGQLNQYKAALNFDGKDVPYFYVLDPDGYIVYATSGRYTEGKMQEIIDVLDGALNMN